MRNELKNPPLNAAASLATDFLESASSNVLESILERPIVTGVAMIGGAAALGTIILYETASQSFRPTELSALDLARHAKLLSARKSFLPDQRVPDEWMLNNNKPKYPCEFKETSSQFFEEVSRLNEFNCYDSDAQAFFLTCIGDLYFSLSKRTVFGDITYTMSTQAVRSDGVEVMFYNDLAKWVIEEAASYRPEDPRTLTAYQDLQKYCELITLTVITNQNDYKRTNPYSTLRRIIDFVTHYIEKLKEYQSTLTLNQIIGGLDNRILGLSYQALQAAYLLIDENDGARLSHIEKARFRIDQFLSPQENEMKCQATRDTQLGDWLYQTLLCIGLDHSSYKFKNVLSKDSFTQHLSHQHPQDPGFVASKKRWGHQKFVLKADEKSKNNKQSNHYLSLFREHLRGIVELYFLSQKLVQSSKMQESFGKEWMYGHPAGKATLLLSLQSISDVILEFEKKWQDIWDDGYAIDHQTYIRENRIDVGTLSHKNHPLVELRCKIDPKIKRLITEIREFVMRIRNEAVAYAETTQVIGHERIHYMKEVLEHFNLRHSDNADTRLISRVLQDLQQSHSVPMRQQASINEESKGNERPNPHALSQDTGHDMVQFIPADRLYDSVQYNAPTFVTGKQGELTLFEAAYRLLNPVNQDRNIDFEQQNSLINPPTQFHSRFQADVFSRFLKLNEYFVYRYLHNNWLVWPIQSMAYANVTEFIRLYTAVNTMFHLMYAPGMTLKKVEQDMIDILIYDKLKRAFNEYRFYTDTLTWTDDTIQVTINETDITLSFGTFKTRLLRTEIMTMIEKSLLSVMAQQETIETISTENLALKEQLFIRDAHIAQQEKSLLEKDSTIAQQRQEIGQQQQEIAQQQQEIAQQQQEIGQQRHEIGQQRHEIGQQRQEIEQKAQQITQQQQELDEKNKYISAVQENMSALSGNRNHDKKTIKQLTQQLEQEEKKHLNPNQLFSQSEVNKAQKEDGSLDQQPSNRSFFWGRKK
jgi:hypothetical protein